MLPLGALQVTVSPELPMAQGSARQSKLTPIGKKVMMTIFAMSCSPLIFGGDLPQTPEEDIALATHPEMLRCNRNGVVGKRVSLMRRIDVRKAPCKEDSSHGWLGIFSLNADERRSWDLKPFRHCTTSGGNTRFTSVRKGCWSSIFSHTTAHF